VAPHDTFSMVGPKHLALRTRIKRLARKTIGFSKSLQMHDIVIGLFVNRYEFGFALHV
jgi:insertion element IS1 protein InsB